MLLTLEDVAWEYNGVSGENGGDSWILNVEVIFSLRYPVHSLSPMSTGGSPHLFEDLAQDFFFYSFEG